MGFITKYGTIWGQIPNTAGNVYWVAPGAGAYTVEGRSYDASDQNDGLSPERAFATLDRGINLAVNNGDVVVALPGNHTPTASLAMDTAGVTLMGLPSGKGNFIQPNANVLAVTGDQNINVTAGDIEIAYLNFVPVTADTAIDVSAAGCALHIHHCSFDMYTAAANTGTIGIEFLGASDFALIEDCYFTSDGAQGPAMELGTTNFTVVRNCVIACTAGSWAVAINTGAGGTTNLIEFVTFLCDGTAITDAISGGASAAGAWTVRFCHFPVLATDALDGFTATHCELAQNYRAEIGGGTGGAAMEEDTT